MDCNSLWGATELFGIDLHLPGNGNNYIASVKNK